MSAIRFRVLPRNQPAQAVVNSGIQNRLLNKFLITALFIVPGFAVFIIFLLMPVATTSRYSLYDWNGFGELTSENYVELDNYDRLINHEVFQNAVRHTFIIMALSLAIQLPLAFGLALLVGRGNLPGRHFFRTLLFIPYVFSEVITALIWQYVLHPRDGLANLVFEKTIPGFENVAWLG